MPELLQFFATCPKGLEGLLLDEVNSLGGTDSKETIAGVSTSGDLELGYRLCLWSRLANKILLPIAKVPADTAEELYDGVNGIDWSEHLNPDGTLWIEFNGSNDGIRNTQFGGQKVKDAIVDRLRTSSGDRPSIQRDQSDLSVTVRLARDQAVINIDLTGVSLHKRGYRVNSVIAPMKENLAAAILIRSGWPKLCHTEGSSSPQVAFIDPMCGSGTLLIEAAMMAADIAPNILRKSFAFERWKKHDEALWKRLKAEAVERKQKGLEKNLPEIRGYDESGSSIRASEHNVMAASLENVIHIMRKPLGELKKPTHADFSQGLMLTNPPYGERLGEHQALMPLYRQLGDILKSEFHGWQAGVFTGNPELAKNMGLRSKKKYKLFNGTIPSELLLFDVSDEWFARNSESKSPNAKNSAERNEPRYHLSAGAQMVANRLKKNRKKIEKWARKEDINCYRIYDADLPEYSAAIDVYGDYIHVQEYAAPKTIDERQADQRFLDLQKAVVVELGIDDDHLSVKQRKRNRGKDQYERLEEDPFSKMFTVNEKGATFWVNLWSYMDTGIFLDHRLVRQKVAELVPQKRFLNLFCYTAPATVQAALAGAMSSVSVDLSNTYLRWADKNFTANRLGKNHELIQADCFTWLKECREAFDVILLDPPSFSNSKRMEGVLDVQRDHIALIDRCMDLLNLGGTLVFSTNLRSFKMDQEVLSKYAVDNITRQTIDVDFERNPRIHQCFLITLK
ncbi:MAG: bifunctional 23S rRNA (guanine(2069)-N(7))-methyltransferase RlmK/23S rRNA (guanine(2445)-N(2))-methyltransferase RlmL [Cellvibrionaceae bacterium]